MPGGSRGTAQDRTSERGVAAKSARAPGLQGVERLDQGADPSAGPVTSAAFPDDGPARPTEVTKATPARAATDGVPCPLAPGIARHASEATGLVSTVNDGAPVQPASTGSQFSSAATTYPPVTAMLCVTRPPVLTWCQVCPPSCVAHSPGP